MNSLTISSQKRTTGTFWNDPSVPIVSVVAHELRNPLANILLTVHLLESKIIDDNDRMYMDIIKRSSAKINGLINELLKGQQKDGAQTEKLSLHQLLDEVIEQANDRLTLKNIMVKKNYAPHDLRIIADKPKIKIALSNIVINAIDAMPSEKGELKLCTKMIKGRHAIFIQDNGCGISKENLPHIFNPYFTRKPGGLGVGLAATKDILLSNKIGIKVESMVGEGTSFILLFEKNKIATERKNLKIDQRTVRPIKTHLRVACMT